MYRPIDARFWTDPKIRELNLADRHAFLYLLTNPHTNMLGLYRLPLPYMADDLQQSLNTCRTVVERLSNANLIVYDRANHMVFVSHFLKYNIIKGGNREAGAINRLYELPPTPLLYDLQNAITQYQPELQELSKVLEPMLSEQCIDSDKTPLTQCSNSIGTKEQEQNQDKEQDKEKKHVSPYSEDFLKFWTIYTATGRNDNKHGAYDNWLTCLNGRNGKKPHDPATVAELLTAATHYADKCRAEGTEPRYVLHATTFLGPDQRWKDHVEVRQNFEDRILEEAKNGRQVS